MNKNHLKILSYLIVKVRVIKVINTLSALTCELVHEYSTHQSLMSKPRTSIIALKASGRDCTNKNELLHKIGVLQRYAMQLFVLTR